MVPREKGKQVSMAYFGSQNESIPQISATILLSKTKALTASCCYAKIIHPHCTVLMYYLVVVSLTLMQAIQCTGHTVQMPALVGP